MTRCDDYTSTQAPFTAYFKWNTRVALMERVWNCLVKDTSLPILSLADVSVIYEDYVPGRYIRFHIVPAPTLQSLCDLIVDVWNSFVSIMIVITQTGHTFIHGTTAHSSRAKLECNWIIIVKTRATQSFTGFKLCDHKPFVWWVLDHTWRHMMTSWNGDFFRVTRPLWGESTGLPWISLTKTSDAEL